MVWLLARFLLLKVAPAAKQPVTVVKSAHEKVNQSAYQPIQSANPPTTNGSHLEDSSRLIYTLHFFLPFFRAHNFGVATVDSLNTNKYSQFILSFPCQHMSAPVDPEAVTHGS